MSSNAVVSALLAAALGSGCATVVKGGRNELILHSASDDLKAYAMGEELALSRSGTSDGKARFKASVPKEAHELKLRTEGLGALRFENVWRRKPGLARFTVEPPGRVTNVE